MTNFYSYIIVSILSLCILGSPLLAREGNKNLSNADKREMAPSIEDHADYMNQKELIEDRNKASAADKLRIKSIITINKMLDDKKISKVKQFELMIRKGELHVERHDYLRDLEISSFTEKYDEWLKEQKGDAPIANYDKSKSELNKAANIFRTVANKFPKHPRVDRVLFELAHTLTRLGIDNAIRYYHKLLKNHPKSQLVPDTYLALGEHHFDKFQIDEAIENYKKVLKFKEHKAYPYAVYKLGWSYYNKKSSDESEEKKNLAKSVAAFKLVIKLSEANKEKSRLNLKQEAINDLVMVWADAEDIDSAWAYFKTINEKESFYIMLERLGNIYTTQGKNSKAITVFNRMIDEAPLREVNPEIQMKLIDLYNTTGQREKVKDAFIAIKDTYLDKNSQWVQRNKKASEGISELVEKKLHRVAAIYHDKGIKSKSKDFLASAASLYNLYLNTFPKSPNSYELRFNLAEILMDFEKWEEAGMQYLAVSKMDPLKGKYAQASAKNAVLAVKSLVENTKFAKTPPLGQVSDPIDIPKEKILFIQVLDNYRAIFPNEKESIAMGYTAAYTFFDYGHYPAANERFDEIIKNHPKSEEANKATRTILGFYGDKSDWESVIKWASKFEENKALTSNIKLAKYINDIHKLASFKIAQVHEKKGEFLNAAQAYMHFKDKFSNEKNAEIALYNAGLNFYKAGKTKLAIDAQEEFLKKYSNSKLTPNVLADLGATYENLVQFPSAADKYYLLGTKFSDDKRAANSLYNSAILYQGVNQLEKSEQALEIFIKQFPRHPGHKNAFFVLAEILEEQGKAAKTVSLYEQFLATHKDDKSMYYHARAKICQINTFKLDKNKAASQLQSLTKELIKDTSTPALKARHIVAELEFMNVSSDVKAFKAKSLNSEKLEESIKSTQESLVKVVARLEGVMKIGSGEYLVASLYTLGELNEIFAQKLLNVKPPKNASPTEVNQIKSALEEVAFPLKDEAYKLYETAYQRSSDVETFTEWTVKTYQKMSNLDENKHPEIKILSVNPDYMAHKLSMQQSDRDNQ